MEIIILKLFNLSKFIPPAIKRFVRIAKQKSLDKWRYTEEGQTALAWLLGAFDADGSYRGWTSGKLYSSIKEYLDEIKELFGLKNKVIEIIKPGAVMDILGKICVTKGMNSIRISSRDIFIEMMNSYRDSLARKRPQQILGNSNYLD